MRVIGIAGLAGSGKSTVADFLEDAAGAERVKFAAPLKDMCRALGMSEAQVEGDLKSTPCARLCGKTPRHVMVTLGTEWGRDMIGPDIWVKAWTDRVLSIKEGRVDAGRPYLGNSLVVIADDCRFANEAEAIRRLGGEIWLVRRVGLRPKPRFGALGRWLVRLGFRFPIHSSERLDVGEPDVVIENDGTVDELLAKAERALYCRR